MFEMDVVDEAIIDADPATVSKAIMNEVKGKTHWWFPYWEAQPRGDIPPVCHIERKNPMKTKLFASIASIFVLAALAVLLSSARRAVAQKPVPADGTISYSGRLSNDAGQPVADGAYAFRFALYDAAIDGNLLWSETQSGADVKEGAFSVLLGSATPLPKEAHISQGWLAVSVRGPEETDFTALAPRQLLNTAAPASSSSPAAGAACAHTHLGESWTGDYDPGLYIQSTHYNGTAIEGMVNNGGGIGVLGYSLNGQGVLGGSSSGTGVTGSSAAGFAMYADGNARQSRSNGGWVKAMARVSGTTITRCYNSQVSDPHTATTVPCGFSSSGFSGGWTVDFGFQVNDRFISITPEWGDYTDAFGWVWSFPNANQVLVKLKQNSAFFIIVY